MSPKYQGYSLTFWPEMPHFHHFLIWNQNQPTSNEVICHQNTKAIALLSRQKCLLVITFNVNQNQSISKLVICHQNTKATALLFSQNASFSSLFNLQSKSINFKFGHLSPKYQGYSLIFWPRMPHFQHLSVWNQNQSISNLIICHQNTKTIALLSRQTCVIFIAFQSAIKINQFQIWSFVTKIPSL